ncbi:uncharacterized protein ATNIH1004_004512 [Aspergillus tanneri]|uniref:Uncharacterized protein n=1 Tax=Aspergillus tanneri TaxID=1220188 RepID=A0A5M9N245_9EURO|nr:uncharacterized protein ATNIH1004_004512 [Aspergillus tanneri]KAA8648627.1 hypothetical protein ATNIH1004_004512 [Aspergillus tanneri]
MAISTLILAPSAWYPPTAFNPIIEKLNPHGYVCHSIVFPSIQQTPAVEDLQPDRRRPNPAPLAGPSKTDREKEGKTGGVVRLVFVTAFIPDIGQSLIAAFGGTSPDWYIRDEKTSTVTANDPVNLFFHDVPDRHECAKTLRPHAGPRRTPPPQVRLISISLHRISSEKRIAPFRCSCRSDGRECAQHGREY